MIPIAPLASFGLFRRGVTWLRNFRLRRLGGRFLLPRIAVFIDADNVHQNGIRAAFAQLGTNWSPTVCRAYGRNLICHADVLRQHGVLPVEVPPNSPKKNVADIALIVDAMDELHANRVDAFCIVSGDGDFTPLVIAIREHGIPVIVSVDWWTGNSGIVAECVYGIPSAPGSSWRTCWGSEINQEARRHPGGDQHPR